MSPSFTNSARNDRRTCSNRENWNPCTTYLYDVLCNSLLWAKCRNLGKRQIGPMAFQTRLGYWKLYAKSMLFSVDFMSLIMNGIILRTICNINIFNVRIMSFRQGVKFWIFVIVMFFNHGQVLKFTRVLQLKGYKFGWIRALSDLILMMAEKKINIQNPTLNSTPWRNDMIPT